MSNDFVCCRFNNIVTLCKDTMQYVVWQPETACYGSRGIFPTWMQVSSICAGPADCVLLHAGELFYPPDKAVWLPFVDTEGWVQFKSEFVTLTSCKCSLPGEVKLHIEELQRKWGIS